MGTKRFTFPDTVPLVQWEDGSVRVRNSRVTLETIVTCIQSGDTVEDIHEGFPTVSTNQIKAIREWYFENQAEADEYLQEQQAEAETLWRRIESKPEYKLDRDELRRRVAQLRLSKT